MVPQWTAWTGAIERVLYPLSSALLVRDEHLGAVRRTLEQVTLGARLVFEAVPAVAGKREVRHPTAPCSTASG